MVNVPAIDAVPLAQFIGNEWTTAAGADTIDVVNPTTEAVIASVVAGTSADVDRAVAAAVAASASWSASTPGSRAAILRRVAAGLADRAEPLAALIATEIGSPLAFSRGTQVGLPIKVLGAMADELDAFRWEERLGPSLVVREPAGVVGAITPWNYPLHQVVAKVAAALAAGCSVVVKPSEVAPLSAFVLAEVLVEAGVPPGVCNMVTGFGPIVGEAIAAHPGVDVVSLTGSTRAGRRVMELAAPTAKRVTLELGGKSASVVLDDVDPDQVIAGCVTQCFRNAGQNCSALSRLVVPRSWLPQVEAIAAAAADEFVVGDPFDPATEMGPLVSATQRERVREYIRVGIAEGARLVAGGAEPPRGLDRGYFVRPTVFTDVAPAMRIAQEEIFGPVLCVLAHDGDDDAVAIANDSRFGLAGAVWSADADRAGRVARRMRTGRVVINGGEFNAGAPFGGYRQSGVGRELGRYGLEEFLETKTLQC
jgi:acyl-CoA reductase-like NAD-dependent aldehyde dehydrogenase